MEERARGPKREQLELKVRMAMKKVGYPSENSSGEWMRLLAVSALLIGATTLATWGQGLQIQAVELPYIENAWAGSAHADATAEAFNHWNDANPPEVPTSCAKCHSAPGYQDFLGADGSAAGVVDKPAPIGTVIDCTACHNEAAASLSSVTFPSGVEVKDLGPEARCMVCHQGRESKVSVDSKIAAAGADANQPDVVNTKLAFINMHYAAAAASLYGGTTMGGYQYEGKSYDIKFAHVYGLDTCVDCHDQHSLEVRIEVCVVCHPGVHTKEDFKTIRMVGSAHDYDGDGDIMEGIAGEVEGLQAALYEAIQAYATKAGAPIIYDSSSHPYFFNDTNGWTPRLVKAAFNYQVSLKDTGAFAHNAKYIIELLYDSIEDLDPTRVANLTREDAGHFAGSHEQWRHWDAEGEVSSGCSKCHSAEGLPFYLAEGVNISQPVSNGMMCSTCHDAMPEFTRYVVKTALFPSGATLDTGNSDSNLCISCHQGRESTVSVNARIAGLEADTVSTTLSFINVHYFAAGATLFGTQAKGAYEYAGKTYQGRLKHISTFDTCTECHETHTGEVKTQGCSSPFCHGGAKLANIRKDQKDYDGDGNRTEGISYEVAGVANVLYSAIQKYAADVAKTPIVYSGGSYPYFFKDTNGNGQADPDETVRANGYASWTPRLLCAAYNLQYVNKDPGAFAHNPKYIIQVMYDSIADLATKASIDMTKLTRP
jgi:hypothetical protein